MITADELRPVFEKILKEQLRIKLKVKDDKIIISLLWESDWGLYRNVCSNRIIDTAEIDIKTILPT